MHALTLVLVVGLGSGVLGTVASQPIAGAFKTRGDTRELNAAERSLSVVESFWLEIDDEWKKLAQAAAEVELLVPILRVSIAEF